MLSIIIPTLNEEKFLPLLLESLQIQDYKDFEVIVADANSKDRTREIAQAYGCRVVKGGSPAKGRNNGAMVAKGDLFLFLDADVILPGSFLKETISELKERKLDVATCSLRPADGKKIDYLILGTFNFYARICRFFYPHAPGCCIFCRKALHNKINGFNEELKIGEDRDYVNRASKVGNFNFLKSAKIGVSMRRWDKVGRFHLTCMYFKTEGHLYFKGNIKKEIISYEFGNYNKEELDNTKKRKLKVLAKNKEDSNDSENS